MKFERSPLPYALDALEPLLSREQIELHYEKHHRGYVDKLEKLIGEEPMADWDLEAIVRNSSGDIFHNA
ncbi:MAG: superoxide dismutase [Fe], partial [bacterium]